MNENTKTTNGAGDELTTTWIVEAAYSQKAMDAGQFYRMSEAFATEREAVRFSKGPGGTYVLPFMRIRRKG